MHKQVLAAQDIIFLEKIAGYFEPIAKYFNYQLIGKNKIPKNRKCLLVINHGIIPFHGFLLARQLISEKYLAKAPRALGASFLFALPYVKDFFLKCGAVEASPDNARILLKDNRMVMLAPGGIYEALIASADLKRIPWERRYGFVELACATNTPIIPSYCPGINRVYLNSKFLLKARIKLLEKIRFSLPIFMGIGLLPFPIQLTHYIGTPIKPTRKKGETKRQQIERVHQEVIASMQKLARIPHGMD